MDFNPLHDKLMGGKHLPSQKRGSKMIDTMSRRKKDAPAPEPQGREAFQLPLTLIDALTAFTEAQKFPTTKSAVLRVALERFLEAEGFWPPSKPRKDR